ncbi:MAG: hydrogenase, partial [Candidatus Methanomethylicia archaeon]|nr:hydrogenase [Candidatus Methanomethylicia archaeon]
MSLLKKSRIYSPWLYHLHCGGCNGCDIEILAALSPRFDVERFGIQLVASPRHADILLITGPMPKQILPMAKRVYEQVPDPK